MSRRFRPGRCGRGDRDGGWSSLSYDASADQYVYTWKTSKSWAGKCYRFELGLDDDTSHTFDVQFKR